MSNIKIILADDHQLFRDGIKSLLSTEKNLEILAEVSSGKELLDFLKKNDVPDIVISDISMPDMNGIELTRNLTENYHQIRVLLLSMHINQEYILDGIEAGAKGYLQKDVSRHVLMESISEIYKGEEYFSEEVSKIALRGLINKSKKDKQVKKSVECLTDREIEIVKLVAEGLMNKEISAKLNLSTRTIDNHKSNILQKLNLKSSIDIVKFAIKNKIIEL